MRVVDDSVQNSVGDDSLSNIRVPSLRIVLRAEDGGGDSEPRLHYFEKIPRLRDAERKEQPVVQYQQ